MDEKNKKLLDQILKYAAERKVQIPADLVLKLSTLYAEDLYSELKQGQTPSEAEGKILMGTLKKLVQQIVGEEIPEFGLMNPGLVPAPGKAGLMLMSTGWKPYLVPGGYGGGGGGGTGISDAPGDSQSYVRYNRTWIVMPPGVTQHSLLTGLDYASSGHTGFQPTLTGAATLALLLPVDGAGSLLDADLLDGNEAAAFQTALTFPLAANLGGTGIANLAASTLTLGAATSITGGGTLALGGFTGTVPATATFAMGAGTLTVSTTNDVTGAAHTHEITPSTQLVGAAPLKGNILVAGNFGVAGWSNYTLGGTIGGAIYFSITNTKTLTLTATNDRNITFPITGTAAIGAGTLTAATTNDVTVNAHTHAVTGFSETSHNHAGVYEPADATILKSGNANWIDLTDGGATLLHTHAAYLTAETDPLSLHLDGGNKLTVDVLHTNSYDLTVPATGTAALLGTANVFTTQQMIDGTSDQIQLRVQGHSTQTAAAQTWELSTGAAALRAFVTTPPGASVTTDAAYMFGTTIPSGIITEVSGEILSFGINVIQVGSIDNTRTGGIFRIDTRIATPEFTVYGCPKAATLIPFNYRLKVNLEEGGMFIACPDTTVRPALSMRQYNNDTYGFDWDEEMGVTGRLDLYRVQASSRTHIMSWLRQSSKVGIGTLAPDATLHIASPNDWQQLLVTGHTTQATATPLVQFTRNDAAAGISAMLGLTALGSGANGDGGSILYNGKSSTTAAQAMGLDQWLWVDATHASRTARRVFNVYDTAIREGFRIEASGTAPMIGFLGAAAVAQQLATVDLGTVLSNYGLRAAGTAYPITTSGAVSFTGGMTTSGGRVEGVTTYTDTCNVLTTDECVIFNKATAFTATMPAATVGQRFYFKNIGAGNVTLSFPGTDTVDEVDDDLIMTQYDSYTLICRLANKWVKV